MNNPDGLDLFGAGVAGILAAAALWYMRGHLVNAADAVALFAAYM